MHWLITNRRSACCLTNKGRSVEPVLFSMIRWSYFNLDPCDDYQHFDHWKLLAMKALFNPDRCKKDMAVQFNSDSLIAWVKSPVPAWLLQLVKPWSLTLFRRWRFHNCIRAVPQKYLVQTLCWLNSHAALIHGIRTSLWQVYLMRHGRNQDKEIKAEMESCSGCKIFKAGNGPISMKHFLVYKLSLMKKRSGAKMGHSKHHLATEL